MGSSSLKAPYISPYLFIFPSSVYNDPWPLVDLLPSSPLPSGHQEDDTQYILSCWQCLLQESEAILDCFVSNS